MPLGLQEAEATRISRDSAHEGGKVVSPSASDSWIWGCVLGSLQGRSYKRVRPCAKKDAKFAYHTNDSVWETLATHRKIARNCAIFKEYTGEPVWKSTGDMLQGPWHMSRGVHDCKIRGKKQRTDNGKYCFVNRTIKLWNQLSAEALENPHPSPSKS